MSQNHHDTEQNFVLGLLAIIIASVLIGAIFLGIYNAGLTNALKTLQLGNLQLSAMDGKIILAGEVVDEKARLSLINPAKLLWGVDMVEDQLVVVNTGTRFWWHLKPLEVLAKLRPIPVFDLQLNNDLIKGTAVVNSALHQESLTIGLKNWFLPKLRSEVLIEVDETLMQDVTDPKSLLNLRVEYATAATAVPGEIRFALNQIAEFLKEDVRKIVINGHTDNTGNPADNQTLSLSRAENIKTYLIQQGVASSQLSTVGLGDTKPVGDNFTELGKAKNRRIEFASP